MGNYKIFKFLNDSTMSRFATRKCIKVNDLLNSKFPLNKNMRFKNPKLRWNLCDCIHVYIVGKGTVTLE